MPRWQRRKAAAQNCKRLCRNATASWHQAPALELERRKTGEGRDRGPECDLPGVLVRGVPSSGAWPAAFGVPSPFLLRQPRDAYGVTIADRIAERTGREVSIGALYTALDRLERKGFVTSWWGEPTAERGGRRKRY